MSIALIGSARGGWSEQNDAFVIGIAPSTQFPCSSMVCFLGVCRKLLLTSGPSLRSGATFRRIIMRRIVLQMTRAPDAWQSSVGTIALNYNEPQPTLIRSDRLHRSCPIGGMKKNRDFRRPRRDNSRPGLSTAFRKASHRGKRRRSMSKCDIQLDSDVVEPQKLATD